MKDALVVPEFKYNLLSVSKLCKDSKRIAILHDEIYLIQDYATRQLQGIGDHRDGLYHLVNCLMEQLPPRLSHIGIKLLHQLYYVHPPSCLANIANKQVTFHVWHQTLGHASVSKLKHMEIVPKPCESKEVYLTCPMAKFAKLPYSLSESYTSTCFELVHIDIWGAYKVPARGKYRYFLTIVDDHSRATWMYLLQLQSQALIVLQKFWSYVHTHFGVSIKTIRSDNALEFYSGLCEEFFSKHGIVHQTSCVDRPQQNGRVERKHKHILEISRPYDFRLVCLCTFRVIVSLLQFILSIDSLPVYYTIKLPLRYY